MKPALLLVGGFAALTSLALLAAHPHLVRDAADAPPPPSGRDPSQECAAAPETDAGEPAACEGGRPGGGGGGGGGGAFARTLERPVQKPLHPRAGSAS